MAARPGRLLGPDEDATELGAPAAPSSPPRNTALLRASARPFDAREVSGTDTRVPETAPGAARPPLPGSAGWGGCLRLCLRLCSRPGAVSALGCQPPSWAV